MNSQHLCSPVRNHDNQHFNMEAEMLQEPLPLLEDSGWLPAEKESVFFKDVASHRSPIFRRMPHTQKYIRSTIRIKELTKTKEKTKTERKLK